MALAYANFIQSEDEITHGPPPLLEVAVTWKNPGQQVWGRRSYLGSGTTIAGPMVAVCL